MIKISIFILVIILVVVVDNLLFKDKVKLSSKNEVYVKEKTKYEKQVDEYVKDFRAQDDFYNKYFADYEKMRSMNNLDNVLIVTTKYGIENNFDSSFIVEAPDYTYFLQYNNEEEKNRAYEGFKRLKKEGKVLGVHYNSKMNFSSVSTNTSNNIKQVALGSKWYISKMGFDVAKECINNNPSNNNIKIAMLDEFSLDYAKIYNKYFDNNRDINIYSGEDTDGVYGIGTAGLIDSVLPSQFGIEAYDFNSTSTDFVVAMDKIISNSKDIYVINITINAEDQKESQKNYGEFIEAHYNVIQRALNKGIISVAPAVGNRSKTYYPAAYSNVIAVEGSTSDNRVLFNETNDIDFVAPGDFVRVITPLGPVIDSGSSFSASLVSSAIAMIKYYDPEISFENVKKILSLYAITDLTTFDIKKLKTYHFERGKYGFGNGLVYLGNTKIFEDVKNKDYVSGPDEIYVSVNPVKEFFRKLFSGEYLPDSCKKDDIESYETNQKEVSMTTEKKPSKLVELNNNYLITNYNKIKDMKMQRNYSCDNESICYANAYYMALMGQMPAKYYGYCSKDTGKINDAGTYCMGTIRYKCNNICPDAGLKEGNLNDVYINIVKNNKPAILTVTEDGKTKSVVIIGITKQAYKKYKDNPKTNVEIQNFVVIDVYDRKIKTLTNYSYQSVKY